MFDKAKIVYVMLVSIQNVWSVVEYFLFSWLTQTMKIFSQWDLATVLSLEHKSVIKDEFAKFKGAENNTVLVLWI